MPVRFKVIQFVCQFPCQLEPAEKTVHGAFFCNQTLVIHDPQHQFSLWLFQSLDELLVTIFNFLLSLWYGQWRVKSVVKLFQSVVNVSYLLYSKTPYHRSAEKATIIFEFL